MAKPTLTYQQAVAAREVAKTITNDNDRMQAVFKVVVKGYTGDQSILNSVDPNTLNLFWTSESNVDVIGDLDIDWSDFSVKRSADGIKIVIGKKAVGIDYIHESPDMTNKVMEVVGSFMASSANGGTQINFILPNGDTLIWRKKGVAGTSIVADSN